MDRRKIIVAVLGIFIAAAAAGFWYWSQKEAPAPAPEEKGAVETAKNISESVPEIQTNPGESVPEVNPVDRANPFKYNNPLR